MRRSSGSMCWRAWLGGSYTVSITGKWCATSFMLARSTHASRRRHGSPRHCYSTSRRGYPPVASGLLDADTVWKHLLTQCLALPDGRPDAITLLTWSLSGPNLRRYEALSRISHGPASACAGHCRCRGCRHARRARCRTRCPPAAHWLVCDILFSPGGQRQIEIAQARARLEPYLAGRLPSSEVGCAWAAAAASALAALPTSQRHDWLARAEQLLTDLKASEYSALSTVLRSGWQQRLSHFAAALQSFLHGKVTLDQLEERLNHVACHQEAAQQGTRMERVRMALRLARYLRTHPEQELSVTLAHASRLYAEHGGYVDWARRYLLSGDETADLAAAFACWRTARQRREHQNKQFAALLAAWQKAPGVTEGLLPIEQALAQIIARLARATSVLLLVMDALSYADCCELVQDLGNRGWMTLTDQPGHPLPFLVSTVPSVTAMARTSLFTARSHVARALWRSKILPPMPSYSPCRVCLPACAVPQGRVAGRGAAGLSSLVRQALRHEQQRVVGVVVNAVDDHLAKSEQLRLSWTVDQFQHLDALLYEAQVAQRAVVVTSDHGYVLEAGSKRLAGSTEERWRPYDDQLATEELVFEGPRVQQVTGVERIIVPWSEAVRYSQKKQGYHGGATPQEVLVPWRCSCRSTARLPAGRLCPTVSRRGGVRASCHVQKYQQCPCVRHDVPGRQQPGRDSVCRSGGAQRRGVTHRLD